MSNEWLKAVHPVYEANREIWAQNERRLRGDAEVLKELRPFDWEITGDLTTDQEPGSIFRWSTSEKYRARQKQATYHNFPDLFALVMVGHLMRQAPQPGAGLDFAELGEVKARRGKGAALSKAELLWFNIDGRGNDGSQWSNWWATLMRNAFATGHRWVLVETVNADLLDAGGEPRQPTREEVLSGAIRPWFVELSPLQVPNWHFEDGVLQWIVILESRREPKLEDGKLSGNTGDNRYLLYVRDGHKDLGDKFSDGGWWRFDEKTEEIDGEHGTLDGTDGEIPIFVHYYERDTGTIDFPAISRPAITALGQLAVSYMNLSSAADFDAWDAALSLTFFLGADAEAHNIAIEQMRKGSRWISVPMTEGVAGEPGVQPAIHDGSMGAVPAEVIDKHLARKRDEAREIAAREVTSTPDSSGRSKEAGFSDIRAPRLALMASEIEQSMNTGLYFAAKRFGVDRPKAEAKWPREFKLLSVVEEIQEMFELESQAGVSSPTLKGKLLKSAAQEKGLVIGDEDSAQVERDYRAATLRVVVSDLYKQLGVRPAELVVASAMETLEAAGLFDPTEEGEPALDREVVKAGLSAALEANRQRDDLDAQTNGRLLPLP